MCAMVGRGLFVDCLYSANSYNTGPHRAESCSDTDMVRTSIKIVDFGADRIMSRNVAIDRDIEMVSAVGIEPTTY